MLLPTCVSHLPPVLPALNTEGNIQAYSTLTLSLAACYEKAGQSMISLLADTYSHTSLWMPQLMT